MSLHETEWNYVAKDINWFWAPANTVLNSGLYKMW
jgi:hypothetical protein